MDRISEGGEGSTRGTGRRWTTHYVHGWRAGSVNCAASDHLVPCASGAVTGRVQVAAFPQPTAPLDAYR